MLWSFIRHIWQFSLVLAFLQQGKVISDEGCWCNGVEIAVSNVKHCFELAIPKQNSWTQANDDCVGSGGHLAHITNSYTYNLLLPHLKQKYLAPIMLGYTVGNAQQNLIAVLCQDNTFMSLLDNTFTKQLISGEPSDEERCIYIKEPDFKMYFLPCDTTSQILCDRPYEKDYCGIEINCSYARTTLSLMRTMTIMREMDTTHLKINQPTAKENMDETTSINQMHLSTAKNRTATMEKTTAEEAVTALWSRADGSHIEQGHGLFATSGSDTTTSVDNHKTESSPLSTSARPPTTSASPTGSSTTSAGEKCPSGSVYLFDWCIPWWIFLITALILLFLLLCCLAWILHCCCKILVHRCQVKSTVINRRISTDHKGNQTEAEVFEGNGTKDLKAKKRISSNSDVVSFSGSEYQNAHCDYIPAPVEAAPIPVIFAPNDDGEKKSETKAAAIIRQATGTEISSAKGSDDHICSHEEVMAKMADISVAANRLSSEHESQNGDESKREFPLNPNSFEKNESVCDMANESTVTKRIRNKPFNEGSQESPRAENEPPDVTKTNNYEKDAGNSQLMSPRRFPSPAPSLVQFSEPPPRMTIVNPEVASRSPRVSCAASQRGVSPKNRPVSRHFPNGIPLESPVHSDQEASNEAANRAMRKSTLSRLSSKVTPDITPPRFSIRSPAKIRKSPSPNPFLRRSHGIQGGVVSRNNAINPVAWKPWAKSLKSFSDNPGFLDDD